MVVFQSFKSAQNPPPLYYINVYYCMFFFFLKSSRIKVHLASPQSLYIRNLPVYLIFIRTRIYAVRTLVKASMVIFGSFSDFFANYFEVFKSPVVHFFCCSFDCQDWMWFTEKGIIGLKKLRIVMLKGNVLTIRCFHGTEISVIHIFC